MTTNVERLNEWINTVQQWNDGLKNITNHVDKELEKARNIIGEDQAADKGIDLLFVRNKLDSMINIWVRGDE